MEKFSVGMDVRKVVTAKNMNEFVGAVNWIKEHEDVKNRSGHSSGFKGGEIRVKYDGEEMLETFSAVALNELELTPDNCDSFEFEIPTFNAEPFTEDAEDSPFAIILEPATAGDLVKAVMIGITPAKVTILDDSHEYAKPTADGDGMLESCESGTARILWKAGESDEQWCVLQLGAGAGGAGSSDFPFKITISGGGTTPPELHIQEGYVAVQKSENKHLFSSFPQFDFEALDDGRYLISGWIRRIPSGDSCGFFVSPEGTQFPTGPGFYVFPIGLIDKYIPEPDPEADPEEEQEEEYCRVALIEQYAWGNFTIPDRYYGLPFVPHLNVGWGNSIYVTINSFSVSAKIMNSPSDLPNQFVDNGINLQMGGQYRAYVEEPAHDIPRLVWTTSSPNDIEIKTLVASVKYGSDGLLSMDLYHLSTYQKLLVRANVNSRYETILVEKNEDDVNVEVNFDKFKSEDGTVAIEEKDGVLDFSVDPVDLYPDLTSSDESIIIEGSEGDGEDENDVLDLRINYDKFESTDDSILIEEEVEGGLDFSLNTDKFQSTDDSILIDKSNNALNFGLNYSKFTSSDGSIHITKLQNGNLDFRTSGGGESGGGESGGYRGMWAVSLNDSGQFTVPASESGNIILTEDRLFENVTQELVSQGSADSSGWTWCYLHITLQHRIELITAQTPYSVSYDYADYTDDYVPLAKYSPETGVIQLQYGAVRINRYWLVTGGGSGGGGGEAL